MHEINQSQVDVVVADLPKRLPVLASSDLVALPGIMMSLVLQRARSLQTVRAVSEGAGYVMLLFQHGGDPEQPELKDLHNVGTVARLVRVIPLDDGSEKVVFQGVERARVLSGEAQAGVLVADLEWLTTIEELPVLPQESAESGLLEASLDLEALKSRARQEVLYLVQKEQFSEELLFVIDDLESISSLAFILLAQIRGDLAGVQRGLEEDNAILRLKIAVELLEGLSQRVRLAVGLAAEAESRMLSAQQEALLREQLRIIQEQLGDQDESVREVAELRKALVAARLPKQIESEVERQLGRLAKMAQESSEYALLRTYLEWIVELPWSLRTRDRLDLKLAERVLNRQHFGLNDVKERILEYLSVRKLKRDSRGPILCFLGPPGVGKTSLGKSIATALNRKFFRISLGGVRDEAEIRGHRRTYVGALPGRLLQGLKQVKSKNPVILLDELDKVGADFRGDPAAALLEVLDPEQNKSFRDHYLDLEFDLSEVLFIGTANTIDTIPGPLLDRLEVISLPGYTTDEKLNILRRYQIPRQLEENGLGDVELVFQEKALLFIIERYTREAGIRNLERELGRVCRKLAREYAESGKTRKVITTQLVRRLLGNTKFDPETQERNDLVGFVHGLAWTVHGGEVMPVEASVAAGAGKLTLTGQLGDVMQESAQAALFYARAHAHELGVDPELYKKFDVHVHVPGGATPKDGPSAGITIFTAVISALTNRPVSHSVAMTGEITLRGQVLPVGGVKEKVLAAVRYGITKIVLPVQNVKDLDEIARDQRDRVEFYPVDHIREVLDVALQLEGDAA